MPASSFNVNAIQSIPVIGFWEGEKQKENRFPSIRFREEDGDQKKLNWGPGGAVGIGCGAGIGVGLVGGMGVGAWPWNCLRFVFGLGLGCGIGIGYGFGQGIGVLWDRPPPQRSNTNRVVIRI
eukprot:Gb_35632 [translate_table: standard]